MSTLFAGSCQCLKRYKIKNTPESHTGALRAPVCSASAFIFCCRLVQYRYTADWFNLHTLHIMATPCCPSCKGTTFQVQEMNVLNSNYRLNAINCTGCGTIISVSEFYNIGARLDKLAKKLNVKLD